MKDKQTQQQQTSGWPEWARQVHDRMQELKDQLYTQHGISIAISASFMKLDYATMTYAFTVGSGSKQDLPLLLGGLKISIEETACEFLRDVNAITEAYRPGAAWKRDAVRRSDTEAHS